MAPKPQVLEHSHYTQYYLNQLGGGVDQVYSGGVYQRGHGLGNLFGSFIRWATPFFARGVKSIGTKVVRTGGHILDDVIAGENIKAAAKKRVREALDQEGLGYKPRRKRRKVIRSRATPKRDIFSFKK